MNFNLGSDRPGDNGTPSHRQLVPFSMVPFPPDPDFVDRPDILGWLREKFTGVGARAALVGLGGVGYVNVDVDVNIDIPCCVVQH